MTSSRLRVRVLEKAEELKSLAGEWDSLFAASHATPFQHPAWLLAWIQAFSPRDLVAIEVRKDDQLVGLAPLLIYPRENDRVLALAGGGVSDYLGFLAIKGREADVTNAVLACTEGISGWTVVDFTDLSTHTPLLNMPRFASVVSQHDTCFVLELPASLENLLAMFSKRQRANLRNARSRTQRAGGAVIELATAESLPEFLDDLFRLHTNRWVEMGQSGVLSDRRVQQFHRAAAPTLLSDGVLRFYRMRVNGDTAAVIYSLFHHDTVYCYLQGFDPALAHLSPGTQLMFAVIEDAVRLGMQRFDFLRGEETYKLHWRPQPQITYRIAVPRAQLSKASSTLTVAA